MSSGTWRLALVASSARRDLRRLVTDAQGAAVRADIAVVNPRDMRDGRRPRPVTNGEVCALEAYGHRVMSMRLHDADVRMLLGAQWRGPGTTTLYTSDVRHEYQAGHVADVRLAEGRPLDPGRLDTIAARELVATGSPLSVLRSRGRDRSPVATAATAL